MPKRLFICSYKDAGWICAMVARDHKHAKQLFYKQWKETEDDYYYQWIGIRVVLDWRGLDVSKLPIGEIDDKWGYANQVYTEDY